MSKPIPRGLMSIASHAAAEKRAMGALHVGCGVLDAVPDGWAKTDGSWSQDADNGEKRDNYRQEVEKLFWAWVTLQEWSDYGSDAEIDVEVQQRAFILGIDVKKEGHQWRPA